MVAGTSTLSLSYPFYWTQFDKIMLTVQNIFSIIIINKCSVTIEGEKKMLRNNEKEFLNIIRENDNPEQAAVIAIKVFAAFLARLEANQELPTVCLLESS